MRNAPMKRKTHSGGSISSLRSESSVTLSNLKSHPIAGLSYPTLSSPVFQKQEDHSVVRGVTSDIAADDVLNTRPFIRDGRTDTNGCNKLRLCSTLRQKTESRMRKAPMENTKIYSGDSVTSPRSESSATLSKPNLLNNFSAQCKTKENKYFIYYPLSSRLQEVSKAIIKKLEGKIIQIRNNKIRIVYPDNYPLEKKKRVIQVKTILQGEFEAEGISTFYESTKQLFNQVSNIIEIIASTCESFKSAAKLVTKSTLLRAASILTRFLSLINKDQFELLPALCLIADAISLKEDVEEKFNAEAVEDVLLSNMINMLPPALKTFALAFMALSKRDTLISPAVVQSLTDIFGTFIAFVRTLPFLSSFTSLFASLENVFTHFSCYGLISRCNNIVIRYRKNPNILGNSDFWTEIDECYSKINEIHCGAAGIAAWDLTKLHPAMRSRVDAFLNLRKLKEQLKNSSRIEPSCFIFDGPPGTLKSVTLTKLLPLLGKTVYVHHVKTMEDGKDFYDMYDNQEVFYMDDVGQQGKSQWRNLINWVSCVPLPLDCATASLKNTKLFNSEIILLTTNQFMNLHGFTAQDGVSDPRALFRRAIVFDWSQTETTSELGEIRLKGKVQVKKFNISENRWDVFNLQGLPGTIEITGEDEFLAWLCSWILSINQWKKNCKENNKMNQERTQNIKNLIKTVDFKPEANNNEIMDDPEIEEVEDSDDFSDAEPSGVPLPSYHREGNRTVIDVPVTLSEYEAMLNADFVDFHTIHNNELYTYRYSALSKDIAKEYIDQRNEWTLMHHIKAIIVILKDSLQDIVNILIKTIMSIPTGLKISIVSLGIYLTILVCVWAFTRTTESFVVQSANVDSAAWENIKPLFDKATSSQISSLERNHLKEIKLDSNIITCGFCFDKYILVPSHSLITNNKRVSVTVRDMRLNTNLLESTFCDVIDVDNSNDLAILKLDKHHPLTFKNIEFTKGDRIAVHLVTPLGAIKTQSISSRHNLGDIPYSMEGNKTFSNIIPREKQELYTVHFVGLCGSVIANEAGSPIGMHVAGSNSKSLGVSILWGESIREKLDRLKRNHNNIVVHTKQETQTSCARVESIGFAAVPEHSSLQPSPLHGIYPVSRFPADLKKYGNQTVETVFKKSTQRVIDPPEEELAFGKAVLEAMLPDFTDITEQQVINGYPGIAGLNKKSSNGFGCLPEKTDYIDFENGKYLDFFKQELLDLEKAVLDESPTQWSKFVWFETLKDELRNEEKEGEPRSFRVSTIHQQVWTKILTADLVQKTLIHRNQNQIMIGCNPITAWPLMTKQLSMGNIFAGDIGKWDGAMLPSVQNQLNEVIISKYTGEHKEMLRCILSNLKNSIVLVKGKMYVMTHSMPSGSFLTAFYNSLINRFYTAMWYRRCTGDTASVGLFNKQVTDYVYGDDKVVGVSINRPDLNALTMRDFFESIGMKFTDANKLPVNQPYQALSEISFLKRDFVYHDVLARIVCPLSLRTLFNTISWVDNKKELSVVMEGKIESIYRELYLHPNRDNLMLEFQMLVESVYGERKWLSRTDLKNLYERNPEEFLMDNTKYFMYQ